MADGAAVAGAVGSIAAPIVQGAFTLGGLALQHKYNKELADIQNQYNLDMWNRQNEYNSPQAQMQRFQEAGLNPNLIYGQGTSGNASSPAVQVAPEPVHIDKAMQEVGKAFNLQQLMLGYANLKKAINEARISELDRFDKEDQRVAFANFGDLYGYDLKTGRYVWRPPADVTVTARNKRGNRPGDRPTSNYYFEQSLMNGDKNWLLPYRQALLQEQKNYLVPQVSMANYEARYYPESFWIGQGSKALHAVGSVMPSFKFNFGSRGFRAPNGRNYYY